MPLQEVKRTKDRESETVWLWAGLDMPNLGYPTAPPCSSSQINSLLNPLMQPRLSGSACLALNKSHIN